MIWSRWMQRAGRDPQSPLPTPFPDLLEEAPIMALLVDRDSQVLGANRAAREFFAIDPSHLPASLLEVTRESRLADLGARRQLDSKLRLVHRPSQVSVHWAPGPRPGDGLLFISDTTRIKRLEVVRSEFVANLIHELKTPLTSLRLAAETLESDLPPADRLRFARRAVMEADNLSLIIDNLRDLAELEGGKGEVDPSRFDLAELVSETARGRRLDNALRLQIPSPMRITADRAKLAQALGNLLDNAAKFAGPELPIEVAARTAIGGIEITVRDHGPGISPEHRDRVFERFYKTDSARTRGRAGSGLGLSIARHLVLAMGGRLWTESAPGGGQVFGIDLPDPQPSGARP
ncbi:MAG TPA: HAMP domain-containing sensor histidine kinase [Candidatus Acidoferrales bacterium]|nr:HAMP domain-containing sensor histidine kinase [Candidatus Acidoferrales bacterium]